MRVQELSEGVGCKNARRGMGRTGVLGPENGVVNQQKHTRNKLTKRGRIDGKDLRRRKARRNGPNGKRTGIGQG